MGIGCTKIKHGNVVEPVAKRSQIVPDSNAILPANPNTAIPKILIFKSELAIKARIREGYSIKYALIACHPRIVSRFSLDDHWIFKEMVWPILIDKIKPCDFLVIDTVDTSESGWQDITADIFDSDFIDKYKKKYDLVCIPDCGGKWADLQIENPKVSDIRAFVEMALSLLNLVGAGGIICYSKFFVIEKVVDMKTGDSVDYVNHDKPQFKSPYYSELKRAIEFYNYDVSWTGPPNITLIAKSPSYRSDASIQRSHRAKAV